MVLLALDYILPADAGRPGTIEARARLEELYYKTFAEINEYYNDEDDTYSWRPPAEFSRN